MTRPTVLLTGATGFLGSAVAAELLRGREQVQVIVLVRAANEDEARSRVRRSLARFAESGQPDYCWERCMILPGDLTEAATFAEPQFERITHVLHLAANTSFKSVRGVRRTNICGTLLLARRMQEVPGLARFMHVGTAFICGVPAPRIVNEDDYPRRGVLHVAEYTRTKAAAELLLERMVPKLPLVIVRPSIVVGHSRLGTAPSASIFWYYRAVDLLRRVPVPLETRKDILPVDFVARALLQLLFQPELRHQRYHISAGERASVSWREIASVFAQYHGVRAENPYRLADVGMLRQERRRLRELLGAGDEERLLCALEPFFGFSACGVEVFDNGRMLTAGVPPPPRFTDYLPSCIERSLHRSVYEQMRDDA
jgi:nucleoside-diphosphate-sugar epimerase